MPKMVNLSLFILEHPPSYFYHFSCDYGMEGVIAKIELLSTHSWCNPDGESA